MKLEIIFAILFGDAGCTEIIDFCFKLHSEPEILIQKLITLKKIFTTSRCVNHTCTLPPKLLSSIKNQTRLDFLHSVARILIGKDDEYEQMHMEISDSVCKEVYS